LTDGARTQSCRATVYVVDDDPSMRGALRRLVALSNWTVRTFESGEEFLASLDELSPGCLVLDVQLDGMSGLDLLTQLSERGLAWPAILMSGSHDETAETEAMCLGARAFLSKPFEPQALLDAIAAAIP
jgi:two-component system, LuxR family, response regulator FixJ